MLFHSSIGIMTAVWFPEISETYCKSMIIFVQ
jgi:hypothetical protein